MTVTKTKGMLGVAHAILSFARRGIPTFQAVGTEHLPYDLVIVVEDRFYKVQVKHRKATNKSVMVPKETVWSNAKGTHARRYEKSDFDVVALYIPDLDQVLFVPFEMCGKVISLEPRVTQDYYWWEDFKEFPPRQVKKRTKAASRPKSFRLNIPVELAATSTAALRSGRPTKIAWPSPEEMTKWVLTEPVKKISERLGVSDNAVRKHCQAYGISLMPRGHWAKRK